MPHVPLSKLRERGLSAREDESVLSRVQLLLAILDVKSSKRA